MDIGPLIDHVNRWTLRFYKVSAERQAREEPLRADLLWRILVGCSVALLFEAALVLSRGGSANRWLWWFGWGIVEPAVLLGIAWWCALARRIPLGSIMVIVALSHIAAFAGVQFDQPLLPGILLTFTIVVCGLLVGEYFVRTWTIVCCVLVLYIGLIVGPGSWKTAVFWCGVYLAMAWLVTLFSRHLERLFEASRAAEERQRAAIVAERTRFAREIHDSLAQGFTGIVIQLNAAEQRLDSNADAARPHLDKARELARQSLDEARRSVRALRSGLLANGDLLGAIEQIGAQLTDGSGIQFDARLEGSSYALSEEAEAQLLRIGQEALTNAVRHADASHIEVKLRYAERGVTLEVRDDGCGMGTSADGGFGLKNMAERAGQAGGELQIVTKPGGGTTIMATLPTE